MGRSPSRQPGRVGSILPSRGDIWLVDLNPARGHEQSGIRPACVVSVDLLNHGPAGLVVIVPITSRSKGIPLHVPISPPEGGLTKESFAKSEDIRSVARDRLMRRLGQINASTLSMLEDRLKIVLGL